MLEHGDRPFSMRAFSRDVPVDGQRPAEGHDDKDEGRQRGERSRR